MLCLQLLLSFTMHAFMKTVKDIGVQIATAYAAPYSPSESMHAGTKG